ncbi:hypothetical protein [Elizabethkingia anophelis]|uniref:hypothetical protein n=1 Tax=Elizabethkingia anophelis TaxID=1117645 RepID=UPI0002437A9A|nr:hypothetical protein [Elizabethkingia anophelis]ATC39621.1 hypothetical protein EAAG1_007045 [Elizabethkingia anophelis Ag1]ATC43300.1 hypothetical protein CMV41_07045 [Elizabethkingia anophelis]ATC46976.1 hypothetical protein CMV40_07045 [Elizabethkingia anophelis]MCQ0429360.1 hypothetical protein [Elizabethkingia anophelis]
MTITTLHLKEALAFDSIYEVLSWYDRANTHLFLLKKSDELTPRVLKLTMLVAEYKLESPKMRYNTDMQCVYQQEYDIANDIESEWLPLEEYKEFNPEVTKLIKNLK